LLDKKNFNVWECSQIVLPCLCCDGWF
jgi:hypothetical protein